MTTPAAHALAQYASTAGNLSAGIAIYEHGTNPQDWYSWVGERLPLDGDVIEVGAGTGALWSRVDHRARGVRLTLADFSPAMCERLSSVPGATVVRAGATELPFPDGSFDGLIANHMLYHLDDPAAGLREFARVLRPGGRLAVSANGRDHLAELMELGARTRTTVLNDFTAETAEEFVGGSFRDVVVRRYPSDLAIPGPEPVLRYLASQGRPPLTTEEEAAVRKFVDERVAADGAFRVRQHAILVTATR
ncbi:class I SAM-dependent methyltransferase [Actinoplanes solisilvae]|uniref:class I SAM-dependent methyltransferase n=1 Tax=Actinoplanes solisilvae TaxID=2486853 RepID=UPI000FD734B7|nr:class I SAM-dependent methyltransferase [Actinoplanes solisilvae]